MSYNYQQAWNLLLPEQQAQAAQQGRRLTPEQAAMYRSASTSSQYNNVVSQLENLQHDLRVLQHSSNVSSKAFTKETVGVLDAKLEKISGAVQQQHRHGYSSSHSSNAASVAASDDNDLRCWEQCCQGRKFSNKSNLIRHQREQSRSSGSIRCSYCNASFSRHSARNAHEAKQLCVRGGH